MGEYTDQCLICGRTLHSTDSICPACEQKQIESAARMIASGRFFVGPVIKIANVTRISNNNTRRQHIR